MAPKSLDGRVALVTGGGSGIGLAISRRLADAGARVLINDVRPSAADAAREIGAEFLQADLASMEETTALGRRAVEVQGHVDILVNNAGLQHIAPVEDFPDDEWARLVQIMLVAPFQLTKAVVPGMKGRRWGRIVNMSSIHGLVASPCKSAYISAKHGLIGLTKTVALEVGGDGVTVNAICPSYVRTPLLESQLADQARTRGLPEQEVIEKVMLEPAAIKSLIDPEEVAALAMFLVSDDARSITGAAHSIDAGWTAR
jgi:3-hydroxybutyrate dehydrogenase